ncbi:MAG: hypothetical protein EA400_07855 [Chromatiaceae bacterium]|nr:MAG: hypothetical protein EA400_07855 [Chromatiaceae bacterium]
MRSIEFTLLSDGSSDAVLIEPLTWLLHARGCEAANGTWADLRVLRSPPRDLRARIEAALDLYPCDLLFVHRDAETKPAQARIAEINAARDGLTTVAVPVVPVRMQEAWLLIDEAALRRAAGNPNGRKPLTMPGIDDLEDIVDPKAMLHGLLREASGLQGHRLKRFNPGRQALRLGQLIEDDGALRRLPAFRRLEQQLNAYLVSMG